MESITLNIKFLPEQVYVATSPDVQGLVAQGRSVKEVIGYAQSIAKILRKKQKPDSRKRAIKVMPKRQSLVVEV